VHFFEAWGVSIFYPLHLWLQFDAICVWIAQFWITGKGESGKFHEATEAMMHGLLFSAMGELSVSDDAGASAAPKQRRRSSAVMIAKADDDEEG
jgi:hypothetical protein